jgi:hypothetical protein
MVSAWDISTSVNVPSLVCVLRRVNDFCFAA